MQTPISMGKYNDLHLTLVNTKDLLKKIEKVIWRNSYQDKDFKKKFFWYENFERFKSELCFVVNGNWENGKISKKP